MAFQIYYLARYGPNVNFYLSESLCVQLWIRIVGSIYLQNFAILLVEVGAKQLIFF